MAEPRPQALLYADVNLNIIDGSSVWAASVAQALSSAGARVRLLSKAEVERDHVVQSLAGTDVQVVQPSQVPVPEGTETPLGTSDAAAALRRLDRDRRADLLVVRGRRAALDVVRGGGFAGRLWPYLTDVPQRVEDLDERTAAELGEVFEASYRILCQTPELAAYLEQVVPEAGGKCILLPPMVPDAIFDAERRPDGDPPDGDPPAGGLTMVYSGKLAEAWKVDEFCRLPVELSDAGLPATLVVVGDKVQRSRTDPGFMTRMREALQLPGVRWLGGMGREEATAQVAAADLALAYRGASLDDSLELSTKLLEYGAVGTATVLNRTPMHERLLGRDYPLFANTPDQLRGAVRLAAGSPQVREEAVDRLRTAAASYRLSTVAAELRRSLPRPAEADRPGAAPGPGHPGRLLLAGHDLKFLTGFRTHLAAVGRPHVVDEWDGLSSHDERTSARRLEDADVILVEWMGPAAVWYSHHVRPDQRLVVRLHRFEVDTDYPSQVLTDAVDQVVVVSEYYRRWVVQHMGLPPERVTVVPNGVAVDVMRRPKTDAAPFTLGVIGALPRLKRLDLALDLLRRLRVHDERFTLAIKSRVPGDIPWIARRPAEAAHYARVAETAREDPLLAGAVSWETHGADVATFLQRVGWLLSLSDVESFHLAAAEGMASGAVPLVRPWPAAHDVYDPRWIHDSVDAMVETVLSTTADGTWREQGHLARAQAAAWDVGAVNEALLAAVTGR